MLKYYEEMPEGGRWILFIPIWLAIGLLVSYTVKPLIVFVAGETTLAYSLYGFFHAFLLTGVVFYLAPRAKWVAAWLYLACNVAYLLWRFSEIAESLSDYIYLAHIDVLTSPALGPYVSAALGCAASLLFI